MGSREGRLLKHLSVRLTWHDRGWNGESCEDPEGNLSCRQDANVFIHKTKAVVNGRCYTDVKKAKAYIDSYLKRNKWFLKHSKLGYLCRIHSSRQIEGEGLADIPPCDSFSAFRDKEPYVHTKNPARKMDESDRRVLRSYKKKPWDLVANWYQVKYFPQDYRRYIVEGSSVALFYTVNFPEESGKFVVGYAVIKGKNEDFISRGRGNTTIHNKSNAGRRWGEEWCFLLDEEDRYRFPFQELIRSGKVELLEQAKDLLRVEPQDERFFRNLSLFIPEHILLKYLKRLKQAASLLELYGIDPRIGGDPSKLDRKIQELTGAYLSFMYPGLPAVGRFLGWESAFSDYEENLDFEEEIKDSLFEAVKNHGDYFNVNGKRFCLEKQPATGIPQDFIRLLEDILVHYPLASEKIIERVKLLIDKGVLSVESIRENPYVLCEEFVPTPDGSVDLSFEDVDYGEYRRVGSKKDFYLNPYRIRALIHEHFKVYREDPGFVWVSFRDMEVYVRRRLSSGLGLGGYHLDFEDILRSPEIRETVEVDWEKGYLTLKRLAEMEGEVRKSVESLLERKGGADGINLREVVLRVLGRVSEEEVGEKEEALRKLLSSSFTFVSGVAGSGKSTLIRMLTEALEELGEGYTILTPTGKSSERLREEGLESETIHHFLKRSGFMDSDLLTFHEEGEIQELENLIVDEFSMVPLELLYHLFKAVDLGKIRRMVFVGDVKQLPPIGYGYPAKDIYSFLKRSYSQNLIELEKSYRSDRPFIHLANKLRSRNLTREDLRDFFTESPNEDSFQILRFSDQKELEDLIARIMKKEKVTKEGLSRDPEAFQILTPKREGYSGSNHINRFVNNLLSNGNFSWERTKLIKLINTYCPEDDENCVETFNGMIGSVVRRKEGLRIKFRGGQEIPFRPESMGYEYDYAYAITVHKSQGSEFDSVVVILPKDMGGLFTRELLYTALTRARKRLYLLVEDEDLLYETPPEVERSGKLFGENLLELPERSGYVSPKGKRLLSKLDLYIATILEMNGLSYGYKVSGADFDLGERKVYLINLNTLSGRMRNEAIAEGEKNIKLVYGRDLRVRDLVEKLGIQHRYELREDKGDYREEYRRTLMDRSGVYVEPDTNLRVVTHNGLVVRSISEAILMLLFDHLGWEYEYEKEIEIEGRKLLPDFYLLGMRVYWEHLGLLSDPHYFDRWREKEEIYRSSGIEVVGVKEWNGKEGCCVYTTEEDIRRLDELYGKLNEVNRRA